jgi:hypothetical protein
MASLESLKTFLKRSPRHAVNMDAWIRQAGSFATQPCRVLDVSRTGVRLELKNAHGIPENFILLFSKNDPGYNATVIWRRGTQIGAEFSSRLGAMALPDS